MKSIQAIAAGITQKGITDYIDTIEPIFNAIKKADSLVNFEDKRLAVAKVLYDYKVLV